MNSMFKKYKNHSVKIGNLKFDSKLEANIYMKLLEYQKKYDFSLGLQPRFTLQEGFKFENKKVIAIQYVGDFDIVFLNGERYIIDAKGIETPVFKIKRKIFKKVYNRDIICLTSLKNFVIWFESVVIYK